MNSIFPQESSKKNTLFLYFLIGWAVLGLVQGYFSDVSGEEAYYWLFSQYLDWGFLDHPPMVGVVTAPGYWLFPNGLGLRLGMIISSLLTIVVIRKTLEVKDDKLFIWIILGMLPLHAGALLLKTDVPLLLFEACFFYFYKQFLKSESLKNILLMAFSIALIMMSKHHGILVVLFTVASNVKLLTKKSFWAIVGVTVLLMLPHTYWQYQNEFATIKFHLKNRIDLGFSFENILYYIAVQPIFFGPLIGVILFAATFKNRDKSDFNRALKFTVVGVLIFFLISTFKVEFHKHWTSVLAVPLIILTYQFVLHRVLWRRWLVRLSIVTLVLVGLGRVYLMYDFLPKQWTKDWDVLHDWDTWGDEVKELSGGLPVVFINHYERASRYSYLTKDLAHCYNTYDYRETQHDLWPIEAGLQGKKVFIIDRHNRKKLFPTYMTKIGKAIHYRVEENFRSFREVKIELIGTEEIEAKAGEVVSLNLEMLNKYDYDVDFSDVNGREVHLNAHFLQGLTPEHEGSIELLTNQIQSGETVSKSVKVVIPDTPGVYDLRFSIQVDGIEAPINSKKYKLKVK